MCLAVPGRLVEIAAGTDPLTRTGKVSFGGVLKQVNLAYVPQAREGDYVTVHVGFALSVVDVEDANLVFEFLAQQEADGARLGRLTTRPWVLMEVCGGQTHAIVRYGLDALLPGSLELVHGPGCPVCVTAVELVDRALAIAARPGVIFCTFGDMLRVPGSAGDLLTAKACGADVRTVYSPLDALQLARRHPDRQAVFFAVGFETTAPATAMAVHQADREALPNFTVLVAHVLVPPAIEAIMSAPGCRVQGFLAAGHVCMVTGFEEYEPLAARHAVPIVVTGFEPLDILQGVYMLVRQLEAGSARVENQYSRTVRREGNARARHLMEAVFEVVPRQWRGIGEIPRSGLALRPRYSAFDAAPRFAVERISTHEDPRCISGRILQGLERPYQCPAFGSGCTPERPLGATMVSSEGACAAYYRYRGPVAMEAGP
jgi:hydrogenase expression/formation protein HypD